MKPESLEPPRSTSVAATASIDIFIVASRDIAADGLQQMLSRSPGHRVVARMQPGDECLRCFTGETSDLLMIDQQAVEECLLDTPLEELFTPFLEARPTLRIMVFGDEMDESFVHDIVRAGAHGFIDNSLDRETLLHAIREVHDGGYWIGRRLLEQFVIRAVEVQQIVEQGIRDKIDSIQDHLTRRESDVLQQVLEGKSTREIARALHLSEQSVKLYLGRLFRKFDVSNRSQLILMAFQRVCPVSNMIQLFRRTLDRRRIELGQPPVIPDPLERRPSE